MEKILECVIKIPLTSGDKKLPKNFENVSLFHQTVSRRVAELSDSMILQLKKVAQQCNSLWLWMKVLTSVILVNF